MRRLLFLAILLAALAIACGQAPAVAVAAPAPAASDTVVRVITLLSQEGMTYLGYDVYGANGCSMDYCVHFNYGNGPAGMSVYLEDDLLASSMVVFPTGAPTAMTKALATAEVAVETAFWPPMTAEEATCVASRTLGAEAQCGRFFTASVLNDGLIYVAVYYNAYATHTNAGGSL